MKNWVSLLLMITLGTSLISCSTTNSSSLTDSSKAYIGMFSGALIGGMTGSAVREKGGGRLNYIAVGALLGALLGGGLGVILDEYDRRPQPTTATVGHGPRNNNFRVTSMRVKPINDQAIAFSNPMYPLKNITMNDKLLNFWKSFPSMQWFFDDGKQAVG